MFSSCNHIFVDYIKLFGYKCKRGYDVKKCTHLTDKNGKQRVRKITRAACIRTTDTTHVYIK